MKLFDEKVDSRIEYSNVIANCCLDHDELFQELNTGCNGVRYIFQRNFFDSEKDLSDAINDLKRYEDELRQELLQGYASRGESEPNKDVVLQIEGYYKKYFDDFDSLDDADTILILYLSFRERKNIDGLSKLSKRSFFD